MLFNRSVVVATALSTVDENIPFVTDRETPRLLKPRRMAVGLEHQQLKANAPRSTFLNREALPAVAISRIMDA